MKIPLPFSSQKIDLIDGQSTSLQRHVCRGGLAGFEPATQAAMYAICETMPRVTLYDVGAHVGFYSVMVDALFGDKVKGSLAFEPTPRTAAILEDVRIRNRGRYKLHECALSDKVGTATLWLSERSEASNSLREGFRPSTQSIEVLITSLDEVALHASYGPTVIKIDVETHEPEVLRGARRTLKTHRPYVFFESLRKQENGEFDAAIRAARKARYHLYRVSSKYPWQPLRLNSIRRGTRGERQLLLAPDLLDEGFWYRYARWTNEIKKIDQYAVVRPGFGRPIRALRRFSRSLGICALFERAPTQRGDVHK